MATIEIEWAKQINPNFPETPQSTTDAAGDADGDGDADGPTPLASDEDYMSLGNDEDDISDDEEDFVGFTPDTVSDKTHIDMIKRIIHDCTQSQTV